jgi:hypothetical protein
MYVFPPYRREFGGKKHQEASFDTLLVQTEITKVSIFSNVCNYSSKLHTNKNTKTQKHKHKHKNTNTNTNTNTHTNTHTNTNTHTHTYVNYLIKSFCSKLNKEITLHQNIS